MLELRQQLHDYVEANVERIDAEELRRSVSYSTVPSRPRWWLRPVWAFLLGAVTVLVAGVVVALLMGQPSTEPADSAFQDLCMPVSPREISAFVEDAFGWEATAVMVEPSDEYWDCQWELAGGEGERGYVWVAHASWFDFEGFPIVTSGPSGERVVDFADLEEPQIPVGALVSGHPSLTEGVLVYDGGFGAYAFGVPPRDQFVQISVNVPLIDEEEWSLVEPRFFAFADSYIEELGWIPSNQD
jgi:hypothetical protein